MIANGIDIVTTDNIYAHQIAMAKAAEVRGGVFTGWGKTTRRREIPENSV